MEPIELIGLLVAAFAGGIFGAALGALPSFVFMGFVIIGGEALRIAGVNTTGEELGTLTDEVAFGAFFGPHITFAAGAAATAYAARRGYMGPGFGGGWGPHKGKNILISFAGRHADVLGIGGLFGILGFLVFWVSGDLLALPLDPIALGVVISALVHRVAMGYHPIGKVRASNLFDVTPFERGDTHETDGQGGKPNPRLDVEPWLPWFYKFVNVGIIGLAFGALGGLAFFFTGSQFIAFGFSAATLIFLNLSFTQDFAIPQVPVPATHHITLPAAVSVAAYGGFTGTPEISAVHAEMFLIEAVLIGAVFGLIGALLGEVAQRIFFMHGDTHWDPPATSIVLTTLLIAVLHLVGLFPTAGFVPLPV